jgi:ElaB/YqjD/DUF883 family membrane-anchored ribosome-binding protein
MSKNYDSVASLQDELSSFLDDIVDLAKSKTGLDGDKLDELKQGFRDRLEGLGSEAEGAVRGAASHIAGGAEDALDFVEEYAHENPWHLVLAAGLIGLAVGALVSRR